MKIKRRNEYEERKEFFKRRRWNGNSRNGVNYRGFDRVGCHFQGWNQIRIGKYFKED